ncbi:hypothetical protein QL285_042385 [Trifolium repens]|nr:hypothetical protein QL285_042385 [Trifolium repens]
MGMGTGIFLMCGYGDGDYSTLPIPYSLPSLLLFLRSSRPAARTRAFQSLFPHSCFAQVMKQQQQRSLSPISQAPRMGVSTKRHLIRQEKEADKKQKLETTKAEKEVAEKQKIETTKAENEVDEKQQVESTKAEKEVPEKQKVESTEDEKEIDEMHEVDSTDDSFDDDAYDDILQNYDGSDWEEKLYSLSSSDAEDGDSMSFPSISVEDSVEEDTSSEELSSPQAVTVVSKVGEE